MSENSQNNTLFISELPRGLKEADISEHFSQFGMKKMTVHNKNDKTSIRVIFDSHQSAEKALQTTQEIKGQRIKINWNKLSHNRQNDRGFKSDYMQNPDTIQLPKEVVLISQQENPNPDHVYLTEKSDDGLLLFFDSAENCESFIQSQTQNPQMKVYQKVKPQIYTLAIQTLEKRTIYADGFKNTEESQQAILKLFETKGKVIRLKPHSFRAVIVQYETEESCQRSYELHHYVDQNVQSPLAILPYFIKGPQKQEAGLIQINEYPPTKNTSELVKEFSKYGRVLATSISPTGFDSFPYGFVLFESYEKAYEAKGRCEYGNVFLYPPLNPSEAIFAFTEGPNANNCLVIYDLPSNVKEPEINAKCRSFGDVHSSYVLTDGEKNAAYVYFSQISDAVSALVSLNEQGYKCDLLNGNVLDQSSKQLSRKPLPRSWNGLLLFVQNFPSNDYGTKNLREDLFSLGKLNIDSCFVNLNPLTGLPNNHGIIFTRDIQTSQYLMQFSNLKISFFKANGGFTRNDPIQQQAFGLKYKYPNINNPNSISPREFIKKFIEINFADIKDQLIVVVDKLSVNQSFEIQRDLCSYKFDWIESEVHKIKGQ